MEDIVFEDAEELVANLDRMAVEVEARRATAGSFAADLALRHCVENGLYKDLRKVKEFWEEVDQELIDKQGELVAYTSFKPSKLVCGRLKYDNEGLVNVNGQVEIPTGQLYVGDFYGSWRKANPFLDELPRIYKGYTKDQVTRGLQFPEAINGSANFKNGAYAGIAFAIGSESVRAMFKSEYKLNRLLTDGQKKAAKERKLTSVGPNAAISEDKERFSVDPEKVFDFLDENL